MYDTDLNDAEWALIGVFFEKQDNRGTVPKYAKRDVVNAILYVMKTGCGWRYLPKDYPHWNTVYRHFQIWNGRGVWEKALDYLNRQVRLRNGKKNEPQLRHRGCAKLKDPVRFKIRWD